MILRYESGDLSPTLLGFHDGIDSWTLVLEEGQGADSQELVALHERAHHHLHATTPWGLAMLLAGLPGPEGPPSDGPWRWLGANCHRTHERYATWRTVTAAVDGLENLRGNFAYLDHVRWVENLFTKLPVVNDRQRNAIVGHVFRYAMSPARLMELSFDGITRLPESWGAGGTNQTPDSRLDCLLQLLDLDPTRAEALVAASSATTVSDEIWGAVCRALDGPGTGSSSNREIRMWSEEVVAEFNARFDPATTHGRILLEDPSVHADQLTMLLDLVQSERLRLHRTPLPIRTTGPDNGRPLIVEFVRRDMNLGPFVILAWVLPAFLRKHFTDVPAYDGAPRLGFLSVDRRPPEPHGLWADLMPAPPALVYATLKNAPLAILEFTTLRSLQSTAGTVDFRGWSGTMILIDSDILTFLQDDVTSGERFVWSVPSLTGSRTIDILVLQRENTTTETYFLPVSPTSRRIIVQWMRDRPAHFAHAPSAFDTIRSALYALVDLLLGALWKIDLRG